MGRDTGDELGRVRLAPVELTDGRIGRLLAAFRAMHVNGGAILACGVAEDAGEFDRLITHHWRRGPAFVRWALGVLPVGEEPEMAVRAGAKLDFTLASSLSLDGELGAALAAGGAYDAFPGAAREAKALGAGFCAALFGERYEEVEVHFSREPWADWFFDIAWDRTWIVVDRGLRRVAVLCVTDTD